uniref:Glyco_hydro_2_C domain-containing protein n=1 Tax=Panagrellus redivivus TaxID=6233 RepID=A0A7E5A0I9_PANRE
MLEWMNANCYRTSHYPYSEQRAYEADRRGIAVVTEVPAVELVYFTDDVLQKHRQMLIDAYYRDKNHPSIIIWSLANEPQSSKKEADKYFENVAALARKLDDTRLITVVVDVGSWNDRASQYVDVILFNRYYGWYQDSGNLGAIKSHYIDEFNRWHKRFNKPIMISEYGAEALPGFSSGASEMFSYQFQIEVHQQTHAALDVVREEGFGAGEMLWNFADFETYMSLSRPFGNHKGVLDRSREPKPVAYVTKERYGKLLPLTV